MRKSGELDIRVVISYKSSGPFTVQTSFTATSYERRIPFGVQSNSIRHGFKQYPRVLSANFDRLPGKVR